MLRLSRLGLLVKQGKFVTNCRQQFATMATGLIVSTKWLKNELDGASPKKPVVLDTSWLPGGGYGLFLDSHIPNSYHYDIKASGKPTLNMPCFIPEPDLFKDYLQSFGISEDSHVVLYDRDDGDVITTATSDRTWWIFRLFGHRNVSVLDGGLIKWKKDGFPVSSGENKPQVPKGNFVPRWNEKLIRHYADMQKIEEENLAQVIDCRMDVHFSGSIPEPNEFTSLVVKDANFPALTDKDMIAGHMKNAKNISFFSFKKPGTSEYLSKEEYLKLFAGSGVDLQRPITTTCYIGHTACSAALAAAVCGKDDVSVYAGSWTEWGQKKCKEAGAGSPKL